MPTKRKGDWIVVRQGDLAGECLRCGDKLNLPLPMLVDVWVAAAKAFCKLHMNCKEKPEERKP